MLICLFIFGFDKLFLIYQLILYVYFLFMIFSLAVINWFPWSNTFSRMSPFLLAVLLLLKAKLFDDSGLDISFRLIRARVGFTPTIKSTTFLLFTRFWFTFRWTLWSAFRSTLWGAFRSTLALMIA